MREKIRKGKTSTKIDVIPQDSKTTDVVILIMETTGVGESTFIDIALGEESLRVGHKLAACTTQVTPVVIHPAPGMPVPEGYRLVLVNTPGFDVAYEDEERNLDQVATWLEVNYHKKTAIGGLIYLYNLIHDRFSGVAQRSLEEVCRLCRDAALGKVVLSTTNGEKLRPGERERREEKLTTEYWRSIIEKGAVVGHFRREANSAWELIKEFIPAPSELGGTSHPLTTVAAPLDAQTATESEQGSSSLNPDDMILEDGRKTDIVIPIMGPIGAGKSTFINFALGTEQTRVDHDRGCRTTDLCRIVIDPIPGFPGLKGYRLVLLDTPGFGDTFVDDVEILKRIAAWLAVSYRHEMAIGGVLYLQDITNKRFIETTRMNLERLRHLCRDAAFDRVILGTTKWGINTSGCDQQQEEEMRTEYWSTLLHQGAEVRRFLGSSTSAWDILNVFLQRADNARRLSEDVLVKEEVVDYDLVGSKLGPKHIVFPVMGPTGAGKSTFINTALRKNVTRVGHGTISCTKHPLPIIVDPIPNRPDLEGCRLVLLDTPGFDDTHEEDVEVLKRIAKWLETSRHWGALVGGVLYFHDISAKRFSCTARQNLLVFSRLCGYDAMSKTALVTTNWSSGPRETLDQREKEMKSEHWKTLMDKGLQVCPFQRDYSSAWGVINTLLQPINSLDLRIQTELIQLRMTIPETEAGQELRYTLKQLLKMHNEAVALEELFARTGDCEAQVNLENIRATIGKLQDQAKELRVRLSLSKCILKLFRLKPRLEDKRP